MSNSTLSENQNQETTEVTTPIEQPAASPSTEKKKNLLTHCLLGLILIVLLLLLLPGATNPSEPSTPQGNDSAIVDGELDLMGYEEIKAGLQSKVDESYMNLKINLNPVFNGAEGKGNLMIQNSSSNLSNIQVSIYLEESNELIYVSPVLKPNQSIQDDTLTYPKHVSSGSYKALAMFSVLNPETGEKNSETGIKLTLTVK